MQISLKLNNFIRWYQNTKAELDSVPLDTYAFTWANNLESVEERKYTEFKSAECDMQLKENTPQAIYPMHHR